MGGVGDGSAEHIARTEDLETPVPVAGRDEVGRLGRAIAAMTAALRESRQRQRELVTDQGPGVPVENREQAFAPAARALPGSGLGLAIVANTVHAHGGTVRLTDPPPGWGACVHIELPTLPWDAARTPPVASGRRAHAGCVVR